MEKPLVKIVKEVGKCKNLIECSLCYCVEKESLTLIGLIFKAMNYEHCRRMGILMDELQLSKI